MKKRIISTLFALIITSTALPILPVHAQEMTKPVEQEITTNEEGIMPLSYEYKWYYREYKGKKQRRLWCLTTGEWMTDWIDIK